MKKKGFTLVELLAVIVILAIIALIAIPLIGNVIEKAKIGALESSVNGLVESANMYYANETIKGGTISETVFDFEDGEQVSDKKLEYKGKVYNGKLILHANGEVAVCIDDEEHYAYKNKNTDEIVSGIGTCLYDGTTGDFSSNSVITVYEDVEGTGILSTTTAAYKTTYGYYTQGASTTNQLYCYNLTVSFNESLSKLPKYIMIADDQDELAFLKAGYVYIVNVSSGAVMQAYSGETMSQTKTSSGVWIDGTNSYINENGFKISIYGGKSGGTYYYKMIF